MPNPPGFFDHHALPVFAHLSAPSREAILQYLSQGNASFREKKLLEFFKGLDWLPPEELGNSPLDRLSPTARKGILKDIQAYFEHKAAIKAEHATRRKVYQQKIYAYFRTKVPPLAKLELEELRDYELELTGRDINWQHYFSFKSLKKIDEFLALSPEGKQTLFQTFKQDVRTYKKNYEKLQDYAQWIAAGSPIQFSFDDWCDAPRHDSPNDKSRTESRYDSQNKSQSRQRTLSPDLQHAYRALDLPPEAGFLQIRKQFRQLTLQHHPDTPTGDPERMKRIISAYETLKQHYHSQ